MGWNLCGGMFLYLIRRLLTSSILTQSAVARLSGRTFARSRLVLEKPAKIPAVCEPSFEIMHVHKDLETRVIYFREIIRTAIRNYRTRAIPVKQSSGKYNSGTRRCAGLLDATPRQSQFCIVLLRYARLLETRICALLRALARVRCCSAPRCVCLNV